MRNRLLAVAAASLAIGLTATPAFADDPNQGAEDFVLTVDNAAVSCDEPTALTKVEGGLTETIKITSTSPIDKVTVKSGSKAEVESQEFGQAGDSYWAKVTLTQDVSNYVAWTCPADATTPAPAPTAPAPATTTTTTTPTTPAATTTPGGAGGGTVPGVGAPDTGAAGGSTGGLLASGLLLVAAGAAGAGYLRRRATVRG